MDAIDIKGLNKVDLVLALHRASRPLGIGHIVAMGSPPLDHARVEGHLAQGTYFDYLDGRVMKVEVGGDMLDPRMYDRDNGAGSAAKVVAGVRGLADVC